MNLVTDVCISVMAITITKKLVTITITSVFDHPISISITNYILHSNYNNKKVIAIRHNYSSYYHYIPYTSVLHHL